MSGKLAPSKSTVYVSNLPFSLTNNDLHKIFEKYGKVVKVTVLKDKISHQSKGVAFVLYLERDGAQAAVRALNNTKMFDRTITCNIANDNGRAPEFIRRREYTDKSRCYECGDEGHLSYKCPKNLLGEREPPPKKKKRKKGEEDDEDGWNSLDEEERRAEQETEVDDSLSAAISFQQNLLVKEMGDFASNSQDTSHSRRKKYKKDAYFSDEEELD